MLPLLHHVYQTLTDRHIAGNPGKQALPCKLPQAKPWIWRCGRARPNGLHPHTPLRLHPQGHQSLPGEHFNDCGNFAADWQSIMFKGQPVSALADRHLCPADLPWAPQPGRGQGVHAWLRMCVCKARYTLMSQMTHPARRYANIILRLLWTQLLLQSSSKLLMLVAVLA